MFVYILAKHPFNLTIFLTKKINEFFRDFEIRQHNLLGSRLRFSFDLTLVKFFPTMNNVFHCCKCKERD